jgi:thiamine-phosphate pyrophosphorylase
LQAPGHLIALSPGNLRSVAEFPRFLHKLQLALKAGLPAVLVREPSLPAGELLELARSTVVLCRAHPGVWCGVHDSVHAALDAEADGVHLGFRSLTPGVVRECVGERLAIGFSAHVGDSPEAWEGADYLHYGPVYETPSKQGLLEPVGLPGLKSFVRQTGLPVFGLGGIHPSRAADVRSSGAGVAVLSGILGAHDPAQATGQYLAAIQSHP